MDAARPVARVVVVAPRDSAGNGRLTARGSRVGERARDTFSALKRLAGEVELEIARDAAACLEITRSGGIDLVVLDRVDGDEARCILDALRDPGPPVVIVAEEKGDRVALEARDSGAVECIQVGPNYAEALADVVIARLGRPRAEPVSEPAGRRGRGELRRYAGMIIESLGSALLVVDPEGRILTANSAAEGLFGASAGGLPGRQVSEWVDETSPCGRALERTLAHGTRIKGAEMVLRRADGTAVPVGICCSPLVLDSLDTFDSLDGGERRSRRGAVAAFEDLSEIKQLERQVMQNEKMASIGQLAAGVAHEINNPMGFIHANLFQMNEYLVDLRQAWARVEALQKAVLGADLHEIEQASESLAATVRELDIEFVERDFAKAIRESQEGAERIRHIVQDLRDFSHQDTESCVDSDLNGCVDSTANIAWTMMKHSVVLEKEYCDLPKIRCYPMQLNQVFMNLLVNGYQAIEEKLGDTGGTGTIQIRSRRSGDQVVISIRDTGVGIAQSDLGRIFDPFFTTKQVGTGNGLGLATCFNIVKRHGGRLEVESTVGEGTTFEVWLPVAGPPDRDVERA